MNISASVVLSITGSILRRPVQCKSLQNWEHLWNEGNLADLFPIETETTTIELLIGNDYYLDFILPPKCRSTTRFGHAGIQTRMDIDRTHHRAC